ncbi:cobyrinate a,c-diamide synthase [Conexibacter sp. DBS9H8]|uniref:cobyrinate a,c-diamide synthase n=1 Tax=Conexibacter sp. DBS9H8 TaxID=2937801 RepID=UPI00200C9C0C|nr:cobyrinate a,c-diamide synthase [Conexibacter sp. DBS9H8]
MTARIVIAGTNSGAGKTTVATGLIGALAAAGHTVQGFKVGPDFIDPSYHALASGRPGRNLDAFLAGPELIAPLFAHGAAGADVSVIEGVMGLFDGASGRGELASTAHVAKLLGAPVVLVVNGAAMARSAAAVIHGFATFDPDLSVGGVIFNQVGSAIHAELLAEAAATVGIPVLGSLHRDDRLAVPERHLGLIPAGEREGHNRELLGRLAASVAAAVDLDAIVALARSAPPLRVPPWSAAGATGSEPDRARAERAGADRAGADRAPVRIAVARGPAFSFHYQENLELLTAAGAELCDVDPTVDPTLPAGSDALLLAGGFPEVYGGALAANTTLRAEIRAFPGPILAECGGLLYLGERLDGAEMCGRLPLSAEMAGRLTLGYREAVAASSTPWLAAGTAVRGHEFHYSSARYRDDPAPAWELAGRGRDGIVDGAVQAGYLHVHWAAYPEIPGRFVAAARSRLTAP